MSKLSTGADATLGEYRKMMAALVGEQSAAVRYLDDKIAEQGADMEVIVPEVQMLALLTELHFLGIIKDKKGESDET